MTIQEIKQTIHRNSFEHDFAYYVDIDRMTLAIDKLSHTNRVAIRESFTDDSIELPRNLFYDYKLQQWID